MSPHIARNSLLLLICSFVVGCGGSEQPPAQVNVSALPNAPAPQTTPPAEPVVASTTATPAATAVDPAHPETKWIGKIPYDVFYDQPLEIAADTTPVGGAASNSVASLGNSAAPAGAMPGTSGGTPGQESAAPAGEKVNWAEILPMPMLVDEVKLLRTSLTGNLQTVATFNKSQKAIAMEGAILAAMASIVTVDSEETSWKPNAHFIRDLAVQINANSNGTGREPFGKTKEPFDKILVILNGGMPPEMDSPPVVPFSEVVFVADMMQRIEKTFNNLKANINTEARLAEDPTSTERELRILLALTTMMKDSSYDLAEEKKYQAFLKKFTDGANEGIQAVKTKNFAGFQSGLNQIQTTCAECHQEYKGSSSAF